MLNNKINLKTTKLDLGWELYTFVPNKDEPGYRRVALQQKFYPAVVELALL